MTGESKIGVGSDQAGWFGHFFKKKGFFGAVSATEGKEGVGALELPPKKNSRSLIKSPNGGALEKGRAGTMDPFPEPAKSRGGVKCRGGKFGNRTF